MASDNDGAMVWLHLLMEMTINSQKTMGIDFGIPAHDGPEARDRTELFFIYTSYFLAFFMSFCSCMLSKDTPHRDFVILLLCILHFIISKLTVSRL